MQKTATADQTPKTVIPKVRYHPSIQTQTPGPKPRTGPAQKTQPAAAAGPSKTNRKNRENVLRGRVPQTRDTTPQVNPGLALSPQPDGGRNQRVERLAIPKVRYHPSIQTPESRTGPTQKTQPAAAGPPMTNRKTVQENQDRDTTPQVNPGLALSPKPPESRTGPTQKTQPAAAGPSKTNRKTVQENQARDTTPRIIPGLQPYGGRQQRAKKPVWRVTIDPDAPRPEEFPPGLGVQLDGRVVEDVEVLTRGQSTNQHWFAWRRHRITASVAHAIARCRFINGRSTTPPASYLKGIAGEGSRVQTRAMSWGIQKEKEVVQKYEGVKSDALGRPVSVQDCGLFIDAKHPWLAASPDGIVMDSRTGQWLRCLEVKCPYKHKDRSVEDACRDDRNFSLEIQDESGESPIYRLKTSHSYYTQIQVQLAVTGLQEADLAVFTLREMAVVPVTFDAELWEETLSKLETFYRDAVLPYLREKTRLDAAAAWTPET